MPEKRILQAENEENQNLAEGNFNLQGKMPRNNHKNTIKCSNDSKFPLECPQIAFRRFRKSKYFQGSMHILGPP